MSKKYDRIRRIGAFFREILSLFYKKIVKKVKKTIFD